MRRRLERLVSGMHWPDGQVKPREISSHSRPPPFGCPSTYVNGPTFIPETRYRERGLHDALETETESISARPRRRQPSWRRPLTPSRRRTRCRPRARAPGSGAISGYTVSSVSYTLNASNPQNVDQVAFTISPTTGTVKVQVVSGGSWYACTNSSRQRDLRDDVAAGDRRRREPARPSSRPSSDMRRSLRVVSLFAVLAAAGGVLVLPRSRRARRLDVLRGHLRVEHGAPPPSRRPRDPARPARLPPRRGRRLSQHRASPKRPAPDRRPSAAAASSSRATTTTSSTPSSRSEASSSAASGSSCRAPAPCSSGCARRATQRSRPGSPCCSSSEPAPDQASGGGGARVAAEPARVSAAPVTTVPPAPPPERRRSWVRSVRPGARRRRPRRARARRGRRRARAQAARRSRTVAEPGLVVQHGHSRGRRPRRSAPSTSGRRSAPPTPSSYGSSTGSRCGSATGVHSRHPAAFAGDAALDAVLSDGSGWSRRLVIAPRRAFQGAQRHAGRKARPGRSDPRSPPLRGEDGSAQPGIPPGRSRPVCGSTASPAAGPIREAFAPSLDLRPRRARGFNSRTRPRVALELARRGRNRSRPERTPRRRRSRLLGPARDCPRDARRFGPGARRRWNRSSRSPPSRFLLLRRRDDELAKIERRFGDLIVARGCPAGSAARPSARSRRSRRSSASPSATTGSSSTRPGPGGHSFLVDDAGVVYRYDIGSPPEETTEIRLDAALRPLSLPPPGRRLMTLSSPASRSGCSGNRSRHLLALAFSAANTVPASNAGRGLSDDRRPGHRSAAVRRHGRSRRVITNLNGGTGNDLVLGTAVGDTLNGNNGNDCLVGGGGDDTLRGGAGTDVCIGGGGANEKYNQCETQYP